MKQIISFLIVLSSCFSISQEAMNDYKYIIVENQYEFQSTANEYRLNEQIVFELEKRNFKAFRNIDKLPGDMNVGACNTLQLKVKVKKSLKTTMNVTFVDCDGIIIYGPLVGESRLKDYEKDYRASLRKAINKLEKYNHSYVDNGRLGNSRTMPNTEVSNQIIPVMTGIPGEKSDSNYISSDSIYMLKQDGENFILLKNNNVIGRLKKSSSGCYLAVTSDFIGIGIQEGNLIKIEFEKQGTQVLEFKKK